MGTDVWREAYRLARLRDPNEIITLLGKLLLQHVPADVVAVSRPHMGRIEYCVLHGDTAGKGQRPQEAPDALLLRESIISSALGDKPYLEIGAQSGSLLQQDFLSLGAEYGLLLGLQPGESGMGWICIGRKTFALPFTQSSRNRALDLVAMTAIALENSQLIQTLQSKADHASSFVANLSHELRTPLHVIMGYSEILSDGEFGEQNQEQQDLTQRIAASAREQLELVNTALEISRYENGFESLPSALIKVDIAKLLAELEIEIALRYSKKSVQIHWRPNIMDPVRTEPLKLKIILKNLVENAIKFTDDGEIEIIAEQRDRSFVFEVRDTGIGIPDASQESIFDPFFQIGIQDSPRGGVGLGLYLVRMLTRVLRGEITVESTLGHGSTFRILLPRD